MTRARALCGTILFTSILGAAPPAAAQSPILNEQVTLVPPTDQLHNTFGVSVAVEGGTIVVGAPSALSAGAGAVFVFEAPEPAASPVLVAELRPAGPRFFNQGFGAAVTIENRVIVATAITPGAPLDRIAGYVFVRPEQGWDGVLTETARLSLPDGFPPDSAITVAVAISEDLVVLGTPQNRNDGAFVFRRPAVGWEGTIQPLVSLSPAVPGGLFGHSVAISESTILVGAPSATDDGQQARGRVFVFEKPGATATGTMTEIATLEPTGSGPRAHFGEGLAADDSVVMVGAIGGASSNDPPPKVHVFLAPTQDASGQLPQIGELLPSAPEDNEFGAGIALENDVALVGAPVLFVVADPPPEVSYVFRKPPGGWEGTITETARLQPRDLLASEGLGLSVAIDRLQPLRFVVGAFLARNDEGVRTGAAYVYESETHAIPLDRPFTLILLALLLAGTGAVALRRGGC